MIVTIILGLFSVFFAYLSKFKNARWGLKVSFTLIFIFLALRYNFGNDYEWYLITFNSLGQFQISDFFGVLLPYEPGWIILNWLFKDLGFFTMNAVLAFFSCLIYYHFIKKYIPAKYQWLAVFLYVFYPSFMLLHASAMRQSVAIMIFVFSMDYLNSKQPIRYFLCIGFAVLFHFTAIILLPVYFLVFLNQKIRIISGVIFVSIYGMLFISGQALLPYFKEAISIFSTKYEFYQNAGVVNSGLGFLYYSLLFVLILYFEKLQNREIALIFKIAIISFLIIPLALIIDMTGRIGMYFSSATMIVYPNILISLKKPEYKFIFSTMLVLLTLFQFFQFFYSDTYHMYYMNYQTIFSAPKWQ